jgi:hypothetical protein
MGVMKIYEVAVESFRKKKKIGWNSGTIKIDGYMSFIPPWMLMYFFAKVFLKSHLVYDQTQGTNVVFSWFYGYFYYFDKLELDQCRPMLCDY